MLGLFVGRAVANTGPVVPEQVLGAVLDAGGPIRVLPVRVVLPGVGVGVVALHRGALLFADAVVVEVLARQAVALLGAHATAGAEQVAALSGFRTEAASLVALR